MEGYNNNTVGFPRTNCIQYIYIVKVLATTVLTPSQRIRVCVCICSTTFASYYIIIITRNYEIGYITTTDVVTGTIRTTADT